MSDGVLDGGLGLSRFSAQGVQKPKLAALVDFGNSCENGKFGRSQIFALDVSHCVTPQLYEPAAGMILS
jgi:hypothetical protein